MERDNNLFYDCSALRETPGIRQRAETEWLQRALEDPDIRVVSVAINDSGSYKRMLGNIAGLPPFIDVRLRHRTGVHEENIIVWVPLAWNDRFMGTGGGGTGTGGEQYITRPDNTTPRPDAAEGSAQRLCLRQYGRREREKAVGRGAWCLRLGAL